MLLHMDGCVFSVPQQSGSFQYQQQIFRGGCEFGSTAVSQSGPTQSPRDHSAGQCSQYIYLTHYPLTRLGNGEINIAEFGSLLTYN